MEPRFQKPGVKTLKWAPMSQRRVNMGFGKDIKKMWVDYEHDEWFRITSVSYYLDDILYLL